MENQLKGIEKLKASVQKDCSGGENCFNPNGCDKQQYKYVEQTNPELRKYCETACVRNIKCFHAYCDKFKWIMDRADHYSEKLGLSKDQIIDEWENKRSYWYMNFYQDSNQPLIKGENIRVFETIDDLKHSVQKENGFRCPKCSKVSNDPYECSQDDCDWKSYGLFGTLGKGVDVIIKENFKSAHMFMPVAWEK